MSYVITHPEKMDDARQQQWQRLAHLTDMDMNTINNLELLGVPVKKRGNTKSGLGLTFGRKRKRAVRKVGYPVWSELGLGVGNNFGGGGPKVWEGGIAYLGQHQVCIGSVPWGNPKICTESLAGLCMFGPRKRLVWSEWSTHEQISAGWTNARVKEPERMEGQMSGESH